jgi:pSer/pThr/pTyr-binding forkhead associated (FHA) protein
VSEAAPATQLQLEVLAGNAAGTTIDIDERLVFGRQTEGSGQLGEDPELSRHHAEVTRQSDGVYQVEDLSSTNGTYVNGTRLSEPAVLSVGDEIELGTTKLVVRALLAAAPPKPAIDVRAATAITDVPAAIREPAPPPPPPPLDLRLRVDLERAEAEVSLGEGQSVRMRLRDGSWEIADGDAR